MSLTKSLKTLLGALVLTTAAVATPHKAAAQDYYVGQIILVGFNFCPRGTSSLEGQLVSIASNTAQFSLLGTIFGGDGRTTYGLPRARGRSLVGQGNGPGLTPRVMGQPGGGTTRTMTAATMAPHNHTVRANNLDGAWPGPGNKLLAAAPPSGTGQETIYSDQGVTIQMSPAMISDSGQANPAAFPVQDPSLGLRYCVVDFGVYPPRN